MPRIASPHELPWRRPGRRQGGRPWDPPWAFRRIWSPQPLSSRPKEERGCDLGTETFLKIKGDQIRPLPSSPGGAQGATRVGGLGTLPGRLDGSGPPRGRGRNRFRDGAVMAQGRSVVDVFGVRLRCFSTFFEDQLGSDIGSGYVVDVDVPRRSSMFFDVFRQRFSKFFGVS